MQQRRVAEAAQLSRVVLPLASAVVLDGKEPQIGEMVEPRSARSSSWWLAQLRTAHLVSAQAAWTDTVGRKCVLVSECGPLIVGCALRVCVCICDVVYVYVISRRVLSGRLGTEMVIIYERGGQW